MSSATLRSLCVGFDGGGDVEQQKGKLKQAPGRRRAIGVTFGRTASGGRGHGLVGKPERLKGFGVGLEHGNAFGDAQAGLLGLVHQLALGFFAVSGVERNFARLCDPVPVGFGQLGEGGVNRGGVA